MSPTFLTHARKGGAGGAPGWPLECWLLRFNPRDWRGEIEGPDAFDFDDPAPSFRRWLEGVPVSGDGLIAGGLFSVDLN